MRTQTTTVKTVNYSIEEINAVAEQLNNMYPTQSDWDPKGTRISGDDTPCWMYAINDKDGKLTEGVFLNFNQNHVHYSDYSGYYYGEFKYTEDPNDLIKFIQGQITHTLDYLNNLED